jgi:hypothetical protein
MKTFVFSIFVKWCCKVLLLFKSVLIFLAYFMQTLRVSKDQCWNFKTIYCMGAGNRGGIWLSYRPARLHRLADSIPWNRFLGSLKV